MYISSTLPYSLETLISFMTAYHQRIWPLQIVIFCLILLLLWQIRQGSASSGRLIGSILTFFWLFVGYEFYWSSFSNISFMAPYLGIMFMLEGLIIFYTGVFRNHLASPPFVFSKEKVATGLLAIPLLLYPALVFVFTSALNTLPYAGMTPFASSLLTLAILSRIPASFKIKCFLNLIPVLHIILSLIFACLLLL